MGYPFLILSVGVKALLSSGISNGYDSIDVNTILIVFDVLMLHFVPDLQITISQSRG